jgi:dTDP-glucose pyrophosphorylase
LNKQLSALILSAGKVSSDLRGLFGSIPSAMIPLNNRPCVSWIIDELLSQNFDKFYITVGYKKEVLVEFVNKKYPHLNIEFIEVDYELPPGNAIKSSLEKIETESLLVVLGDTIFSEDLDLSQDVVFSSKKFLIPQKWCLVKKDSNNLVLNLEDKQNLSNTTDYEALIGLYYFKDFESLKYSADTLDKEEIEISNLIDKYRVKQKIKVTECKTWLDLGHLDNYYLAKFKVKQTRHFNSLEYNPLLGVVTKRSQNKVKFRREINWYLELPKELKALSPRIIDYSIGDNPYVQMEYYGYPTLAETFLYGDLDIRIWSQLSGRIIDILKLFHGHKAEVSEQEYKSILIDKTNSRLEDLTSQSKAFSEIFSYDDIYINGTKYKNFNVIKKEIYTKIQKIIETRAEFSCVIHGDFCFSNILMDLLSGITRLIDPRGTWGSDSIFGDLRYDLAKLRHSVSGGYDFIVNDLFKVERNANSFELNFFSTPLHDEIGKSFDSKVQENWNLDDVKLIEGLLFLSMLPYHSDYDKRQLAMYCRGIKILNELTEGK